MIKLHFYKQGTDPELPGLRYSDASHGIWGYLAPQSLNWYLGYKDIQTMENELEDRRTNSGGRSVRRRRTIKSKG